MANLDHMLPHERERLFQKEDDDVKAKIAAERADLASAKTRRELVELFAGSSHQDPVFLARQAYEFITEEISE